MFYLSLSLILVQNIILVLNKAVAQWQKSLPRCPKVKVSSLATATGNGRENMAIGKRSPFTLFGVMRLYF